MPIPWIVKKDDPKPMERGACRIILLLFAPNRKVDMMLVDEGNLLRQLQKLEIQQDWFLI